MGQSQSASWSSSALASFRSAVCEGYFEFQALGPTAIKGLDAPVEVYEVVRVGPLRTHFQLSALRGLTKFVGREREMAAMAGALEQARAGHGQIVAAVGEAGAGKSRLMYEFKATIPDECKVLEAYSVSHGKGSAFGLGFLLCGTRQPLPGGRPRRAKARGRGNGAHRSIRIPKPFGIGDNLSS